MDDDSTAGGAPERASAGAKLVAADGRPLPLESTALESEGAGGLARTVLRQRFRNDETVPLEVTYLVPLPADGAVSGYAFELSGVTTRGVVEKTEVARERYEQALIEGKSAALLEEERSSVFRQRLGNVPPGQHIDISVTIDQPLTWTSHGWELRFPTVVAPRYQNAASDASTTIPIALGPSHDSPDVRATHSVTLAIQDALTQRPSSPSHTLSLSDAGAACQVRIENARLDRDVVIRWGVAAELPGAQLQCARPPHSHARSGQQYALLTLTPPLQAPAAVARDLIVLLDTSGSMAGEPLAQALRIVSAVVQSLSEGDRLELIEFGSSARRWKKNALPATAANKTAALSWLRSLRAGGGTEMKSGIDEALASLRDEALRQIVLVTDGLIGAERQILQTLTRRLPRGCRLHTVGIGHGTNRSLLQPAARAGRGVELVIAPNEDVEPACARLLERIAQPLVVNLQLSGSALLTAPKNLLDLHGGSPSLIALALRAEGGSLEITGDLPGGHYEQRLQVAPCEPATGPTCVLALYARERVQDLELELAAGNIEPAPGDAQIEALGVDFQISTRLTSWVAVSDAVAVDPTHSTRRVEQPHLLPAGMSAEGLGLRAPLFAGAIAGGPPDLMEAAPTRATVMRRRVGAAPPPMAMAPSPAAAAYEDLERGGGGLEPAELLNGVVRINNDKRLAVSFTLHNGIDWSLPGKVTIRLADEVEIEVEVESKHSTHSGKLGSGHELRLVMKLEGALPGRPIAILIAGEPGIIVELLG